MNYDSDISTEVSLSRILDEMIVDGTPHEIVVSFLRGHEDQIPEIYAHSAFVYDLYDLVSHPYRVDRFLLKHIQSLNVVDFRYAISLYVDFLRNTEVDKDVLDFLRRVECLDPRVIRRSILDRGLYEDAVVARGDMDLGALLSRIGKDFRDVSSFMECSYLVRSVFQAPVFLNLPTDVQFLALKFISQTNSERSHLGGRIIDDMGYMVGKMLVQLLDLNQMDIFNWCVNVLRTMLNWKVGRAIMFSLQKHMPASLLDCVDDESKTFPEVVFSMNLLVGQLDPVCLFLYIYLFGREGMIDEMRENSDLLEFFDLPFDWMKLERIQQHVV